MIGARSDFIKFHLTFKDKDGYIFTPTALYLEAESENETALNALRLSKDQIAEAQARLSPVAKEIALVMASTPEEKKRIEEIPVEVGETQVENEKIRKVDDS